MDAFDIISIPLLYPYCKYSAQASTRIVKAARCRAKTKAFPKSVAALPYATLES
jgi:hypothetical protein